MVEAIETLRKSGALQRGIDRYMGQDNADMPFPFGLGAVGSVHEVIADRFGDYTAATGFAMAGCSALKLHKGAQCLWVGQRTATHNHGAPYAGGMASLAFGDDLRLGYVACRKACDVLWCVEEAINAQAVRLIIAEVVDVDFTASRRLVLAAAKHGVGVILLLPHGAGGATAATARWRVAAQPSAPNAYDSLGLGRARWQVSLERARHVPQKAGSEYNVDWDDATLSLSILSKLAPDAAETDTGGDGANSADIYAFRPDAKRVARR